MMRWSRLHALLLSVGFGVGLGASACVLPNSNHCYNLAIDPNVWCSARFDDRPYCSPCVADNYGCVATEPSEDECPGYTPSATETGGTGGTETGAETTGTGDETGTGGETETGA